MTSHELPLGANQLGLAQLNERSREIFRLIVESYLATGEPVGSRNLSRILPMTLSPASVRNVMSDLEQLGLIYAPHTSAGRLPTEAGLRLFVHGLLELGNLAEDERHNIEILCAARGKSLAQALEEATAALSGSSTIIAPYSDGAGHIVGVLGVIGPTRLNYARVIPTVDYAARIVSRMLGG